MARTSKSPAFKKKVALEALREESTLEEISQKFGIHPIQVSQWKKTLIEGAEAIFEKKTDRHRHETEKEALERKVGQLSIELDFLKKKLGY